MGISQARYSEIELGNVPKTLYQQALVAKGLKSLIAHRKENFATLEADFEKYKNILLEQREEFS